LVRKRVWLASLGAEFGAEMRMDTTTIDC